MVAMANPQRENGHLDVANELADWLARAPLNGSQFRLLWTILRKTYGWQKKEDRISAEQVHDATGLHKQVVARELRDLAKRRYIVAIGDIHHAKVYRLQKDYQRWDDGKVYTDWLTAQGAKCIPIGAQVYTDPLTEVYTDPLTTITKITTTKNQEGSESHDSASGGTLRDRFEAKYKTAPNKIAVIGELFSMLLGGAPNYRRLGALTKELNSGGKLMDLIIDASKQRITDDPHDYLAAMVKRVKADRRPGKLGQADLNSGKHNKYVD
jgi:phage replication O-like protein O